MKSGPILVICGTLIGSLLLALFLFTITAGAALPGHANDLHSAELVADAPETPEVGAPESTVDQSSSGIDCQLGQRFPPSIQQWCPLITRYADKHDLSPDLVAALIWQESGGDPLAYSHSGAVGLMQVMPKDGLAAGFICANGPCFSNRPTTNKLQDPEFNIAYGTRMLAGLLRRDGNLREALRSYGPMNVGYSYADKVLGIYQRYGRSMK